VKFTACFTNHDKFVNRIDSRLRGNDKSRCYVELTLSQVTPIAEKVAHTLRKISVPFVPPNPKELETATLIVMACGW